MKAIEDYSKIVDFCIGNTIRAVKRTYNTQIGDLERIREILSILDQSEKFTLVIRPNIRGGDGFINGGTIKPSKIIVVPNDLSEQYDRLSVILGSQKAGSTAESFNEFTAILDTLLKNGKIPIKIYRTFLKRYHELD